MAPKDLAEILAGVKESRRGFLKKVLKGAAFAVPVVTSLSASKVASEIGLQIGSCVCPEDASRSLFVPLDLTPSVPVDTPPCCGQALQTIRDISIQLVLGTELSVDGGFGPQAPDQRASLTVPLAAAIELIGKGIGNGGTCRKNVKPYADAIVQLQNYKQLLSDFSILGQLPNDADAAIAALQEIVDGNC
jgi:hypothetical protein